MQASKSACKSQKNVVILHRVRQLKRKILLLTTTETTSARANIALAKRRM
jgi:hypothetical protein